MQLTEEKIPDRNWKRVIQGWQCPVCLTIYQNPGQCLKPHDPIVFKRPIFNELPLENGNGS